MGKIKSFPRFILKLFVLLLLVAGCRSKQNTGEPAVEPGPKKEKKSDVAVKMKNILFFGNSLTAGYGIDPSEAFPALIQSRIDSLGYPYKVINAGLSGETSAGGKNRIDWVLNQPVDIFLLELGGNDGLRGIPVSETEKNLQVIIDKVRAKYPDARLLLIGIQVPPNMGERYSNDFRAVFRELAKRNQLRFLPFLLEGVGGVPELNQNDGIHPTAPGHRILAENVWKSLTENPTYLLK